MSVRVSAFPFPFPVSQSVVSLSDSDLSKRSDVKGRKGGRTGGVHCAVRRDERGGLGGVNVNGSELALGGVCVRGRRAT